MNGPLIFTLVHIIKALECVEQESTSNETYTLKQLNQLNGTEKEIPDWELPRVGNQLQQCSCPCSAVPRAPVCGRTTNGLLKTFDSQCHLICYNQCGPAERYAIIFYGECPVVPAAPLAVMNRKNVYSAPYGNRRNDLSPSAYSSVVTPTEWECDCSYCPETRWIRLDYYPICGERAGQKITFDSWCHFDCENKCVRHTGYSYLYVHKGPCQLEQEDEIVIPRSFSVVNTEPCNLCNLRCKEFFEPVCAKNNKDEFLSFKSRCHLRCHNQCHYQDTKDNFVHIFDGQCPWL